SRVPWAEPGGRFTRDFGSECAWLMTVAGQKTVSGFPHIAWRTAGDGAGRIDSSVAEHRPNAERVLDSFHIVSWMTDALDRVGKRLWNQARRDGNTTATEAMRGVEYAVPGNPGDLTERQSTALATLADADPEGRLYRSWQLRELLRTLLRQPVERAEAELKRWIGRASRRRIPEIVEPCGKIRRRRDDILTTIRLGCSNAGIEAFNNKIKVTIRMAYGFRDTDNLIAMIKLRCSGPLIHLPTPIP
uniref:transposase n=1 Tax=Bifidobacterium pullorum TaxID=78448 RepID=UPI0024AE15A3